MSSRDLLWSYVAIQRSITICVAESSLTDILGAAKHWTAVLVEHRVRIESDV